MKPRTKLQKRVTYLSSRLYEISKDQKEWAYNTCIVHQGYANKTSAACLGCGNDIPLESIKRKRATCNGCGRKLRIEKTLKRKHSQTNYFAIAELVQEFQVIRNFEIKTYHKKGEKVRIQISEILQYWLRDDQKFTMIGLRHNVQGYCDSWGGDWSIRKERGWYKKYEVYPRFYHPSSVFEITYSKYGINHRLKGMTFLEAKETIPKSPKAETLLKSKQYGLLGAYINNRHHFDRYWASIKIALRNKYKIADASVWFDYLQLLQYFQKDIKSIKYICPKNLKKEHDRLVIKKQLILARRKEEERKKQMHIAQKSFAEHIKPYKTIRFKDSFLTVVPLKTVSEFLEEAEALKHCLFTNEYYEKRNVLILSARVDGKPIETIEVCLTTFKVLQSRGLHNNPSQKNKEIIKLVESNIEKISAAAPKKTKVRNLKKREYVAAV